MKNELSNIYANQVLITESKAKNNTKKPNTVAGHKGATKMGELEGAEKAHPAKGATEKVAKTIKKPTEDKKLSEVKGKPSKMKESTIPQAFDQIFQSIINEEFGEETPKLGGSDVEDDLSSGDEYGDELGSEDNNEGEKAGEEKGEDEFAEEGEDDVAADLKAIVAQLQELVAKLSGEQEEEEGSEEGGEEEAAPEEKEEAPEAEQEEESPYGESLDLKGTLSELSKSLGELLQKKDNKVKGVLAKAKGGKASEGNIPEQDGTPKAFSPDIKKLQNPKGTNVVSTIKKGDYLFK